MSEDHEGPPPLVSAKKKIGSQQNSKKNGNSNTIKKQAGISSVKISPFNVSNLNEKQTVKKKSKIDQEEEEEEQQKQNLPSQKFTTQFHNSIILKEDERKKKIKDAKYRQQQKSKTLIHQIMNKINSKNVTEQVYPVDNETMEKLITGLDRQINDLNNEIDKTVKSIKTNSTNFHLKKQLDNLKISINRCNTIKQLYLQNREIKNKNSLLQTNIISLKLENQSLKVRISKGIQIIENHMHNLPCERQKSLIEELQKCKTNFSTEYNMRRNLQQKISQMVLNFGRFHQEATTARLIITKQLKDIQVREKNLLEEAKKYQSKQKELSTREKKQTVEDTQSKKSRNINIDDLLSRTPNKKEKPKTIAAIDLSPKPISHSAKLSYNLEQKIQNMRNNQILLSKMKK